MRSAVVRLVAVVVVSLGAGACAGGAAAATAPGPSFSAHGSVEQVYATGLRGGTLAGLWNRRGVRVASKRADSLGGALFRGVSPGSGYRVRAGGRVSAPLTVIPATSDPPSTRIYDQRLPAGGYGYLTTRDGIKLAIDVRLPAPASAGPYPTLVEYSGYGYADPAGAESGISQIATLLGFAVVDVNIRGTGCSGGAFDYFEPLESLDGYDVIETVARQPWVLHHRVGMMGISYGGISQLFVGATDPPHLAAIAPLSVMDSSAGLQYPGGLLNTGFTLTWAAQRDHDAEPASSTGGQPWAFKRIQQGDATCKANQALHGEAVNMVAEALANPYFVPSLADPIDPITFVDKITAPVYLACQWTDEQTGGDCADLASRFTGARRKWFTFTNGFHFDSLDPATFTRMYDFLELFVAQRDPRIPAGVTALAPQFYQSAIGVPGVALPTDPIQSEPDYAAALAAFERLPSIRILFDNGAGSAIPGAPVASFSQSFSRWPIPGTQPHSWYLDAGGSLTDRKPPAGSNSFTWNKAALPATDFSGSDDGSPGGLWNATPSYHWEQSPAGTAVSYLTRPLSANTAIIGAGAVQVWIRASVPDVDLQVTVSEVRPDGKETFVQNGWLNASERKLDRATSTPLDPMPTFLRADAAPLPRGRFTEVTVPLYYEGHVYRKGSRIRIVIAAPGGEEPVWSFGDTVPRGRATVAVAYGGATPSRAMLPVVPDVSVPTGLPPCPGLRGEPCRTYRPLVNRAG